MNYSIRQNGNTWELVAADGAVVGTFADAPGRSGYELALAALGGIISAELLDAAPLAQPDATGEEGLLPEWWQSDAGIAFSVATAGGRDFSTCSWSWRDPATSLIPVMFQTKNLPAHMEAELAGFVTDFTGGGVGQVGARGRFYDSDVGTQARDTLAAGGRFGVSVDPTENVDWSENFECIAFDDQGDCVDGELSMVFHSYEIGGFTLEPHPCFEQASIVLMDPNATAAPMPMMASAAAPTAPPSEWMNLAEPAPGEPFLNWPDGADVLVEQVARSGEIVGQACPLTIRDDGLVYGHLTYWGQCHVADPWGPGVCASATPSRDGYASFHSGHVLCADGTDVPTGVLTVGCEHSTAFDIAGVQDHLAHAGLGWADVRVIDGMYGPWLCGVLKQDVTDEQVRLLRSLSLSGEWVGELAGILAVNTPGLPVQRALAASAFSYTRIRRCPPGTTVPEFVIPEPVLRSSARNGELTKLVGGNLVRDCPECGRSRLRGEAFKASDLMGELRSMKQMLTNLEQRTRHLVPAEAEAISARLRGD